MKADCWEHYCEVEKTEMGVGKHEPCNWCGLTEETYGSLHGDTKELLIDEARGAGSLLTERERKLPGFRTG